jgi:hypothetical protein
MARAPLRLSSCFGTAVLAASLAGASLGAGCTRVKVDGSGGTTNPGSGGAAAGTGGAASGSGGAAAGTGGAAPGSGGAVASTGGAATGGASTGGTPGTGGVVSGSGGSGVSDAGMSDRACQMAQYTFEPKIPNVFVLVDRSGSMFDVNTNVGLPMGAWVPLRTAVLQVIRNLEHDIRFGFGAFAGTSGMCPVFPTVGIAPDNYNAINMAYTGLGDTRPFNNSETPVYLVLPTVRTMLNGAGPGDKYILFVTDGEPDYCDNGNALCPIDDVVATLQSFKAEGIHTFVFGVRSANESITPEVLQAFANAGANAAVAQPYASRNIFNECNGYAPWKTAHTAAGRTMDQSLGTYTTPGGTTTYYRPNPADQTALANQIATVVAGVKSCLFDLGDVNGKSLKVDLMQLDKARVLIMDIDVPQSETNGWRMVSQSQLELTGTACTNWRKPENTKIDFRFPCSTIIFE